MNVFELFGIRWYICTGTIAHGDGTFTDVETIVSCDGRYVGALRGSIVETIRIILGIER